MAENRLFLGFVEKKVGKVYILAHNEIRWATVGKYVRGFYYKKSSTPSPFPFQLSQFLSLIDYFDVERSALSRCVY